MRTMAVIIAGLLLISSPLYADTNDGNEVLKRCKLAQQLIDNTLRNPRVTDLSDSYYCLGMLEGVWRTMRVFARDIACLPKDGITRGQTLRIVVEYLQDRPAVLHHVGSGLVMEAFADTYPCYN